MHSNAKERNVRHLAKGKAVPGSEDREQLGQEESIGGCRSVMWGKEGRTCRYQLSEHLPLIPKAIRSYSS